MFSPPPSPPRPRHITIHLQYLTSQFIYHGRHINSQAQANHSSSRKLLYSLIRCFQCNASRLSIRIGRGAERSGKDAGIRGARAPVQAAGLLWCARVRTADPVPKLREPRRVKSAPEDEAKTRTLQKTTHWGGQWATWDHLRSTKPSQTYLEPRPPRPSKQPPFPPQYLMMLMPQLNRANTTRLTDEERGAPIQQKQAMAPGRKSP